MYKMYIGLNVHYRYCCEIVMKLEFLCQIFDQHSVQNFMKNRPMKAEFVSCGRTDGLTDRRTDGQAVMTHIIAAFCNFENELTKSKQKTRLITHGSY
jgi:hypothetical protein